MTNAEISAGFEALCVRAAGWACKGPESARRLDCDEGRRIAEIDRSVYPDVTAARLAFFARLMAWIFANLDQEAGVDRADRIRRESGPSTALLSTFDAGHLLDALRSYHAGTDRGELKALLERAWGPSPKRSKAFEAGRAAGHELARGFVEGSVVWKDFLDGIAPTSDLRGLAAREAAVPICLCPATSEYDPPCPRHGYLPIGVTGRSDG